MGSVRGILGIMVLVIPGNPDSRELVAVGKSSEKLITVVGMVFVSGILVLAVITCFTSVLILGEDFEAVVG